MSKLQRRAVLKGLAAMPIVLASRRGWAAEAGPAMASKIDIEKAKAEGRLMLYTSLDTKIVDAIIGPFKKKYGITRRIFSRRFGRCDLEGPGGSRCWPHPGRHGRCVRSRERFC